MEDQASGRNRVLSLKKREVLAMTYHYKDSGLDRVFLVNGYEVHATPHGDAVSIHDVDGLHRAIARAVVRSPKPIDGAEFRFLRKHLDLSQKALANLIGAEEQNLYRWERFRSKAVPGMADRLIRVLFQESDDGRPGRWILDRLADLDPVDADDIKLDRGAAGWSVAA